MHDWNDPRFVTPCAGQVVRLIRRVTEPGKVLPPVYRVTLPMKWRRKGWDETWDGWRYVGRREQP
jgi:hypothetical protein